MSTTANSLPQPKKSPSLRLPIRSKITLPYLFLALVLSLGVGLLATRVIFETVDERFNNQLYEAGKLAADAMVGEENRMLETLRLLAYTQGVPEAITTRDSEKLRELTYPAVVNAQAEAVEFLDRDGNLALSMRHRKDGKLEEYDFAQGGQALGEFAIVKRVLTRWVDAQGDKYADMIRTGWGDYLYIAGPVFDGNNNLVGVILVGKSLTRLVRQLREETLAQVTIYTPEGQPLASTFSDPLAIETALAQSVLAQQDNSSYRRNATRRELQVRDLSYGEILGPWEVRGRTDLGMLGSALVENMLVTASLPTRLQIVLLIAVAVLLVLTVGFNLANLITRPLLKLVNASQQVSGGNLQVNLPVSSRDEVGELTQSFNQMVHSLYQSKEDLIKAYDNTLEGWSRAMELRDKETQGHTVRVANLTADLGRMLGLDSEQVAVIRRGAMIHDIGKMGVPDEILQKQGPLNDDEWEIMRRHPQFAHNMLKDIDYLQPALDIPYSHHEKWDGSGYPRGLRGEQIPLAARLFAIVDVWDALTSDRPYRRAITPDEAFRIINAASGKHFDPRLVDLFVQYLNQKHE